MNEGTEKISPLIHDYKNDIILNFPKLENYWHSLNKKSCTLSSYMNDGFHFKFSL